VKINFKRKKPIKLRLNFKNKIEFPFQKVLMMTKMKEYFFVISPIVCILLQKHHIHIFKIFKEEYVMCKLK